jgi:hypothetical protein
MTPQPLNIEYRPIEALIPYASNSRTHSDAQVAQIAASIREFGWTNPVLVDGDNGIIAGHGRVLAARKLGMDTVPVIELAHLSEAQRRAYIIADNKLAENAGWDDELLRLELGALRDLDFDLSLTGFENDELNGLLGDMSLDVLGEQTESPKLSDRFLVPPFSVLSARDGWWMNRKAQWIGSGITSEDGRDENIAFSQSSQSPHVYKAKNDYEHKIGRKVTWPEFIEANPDTKIMNGTSVFDPVLCEIAYRWFSPVDGVVLDPFAGGSVRGVVAAKLGRQYVGCDIRPEQVEANRTQWSAMDDGQYTAPVWHCGDSCMIDQHAAGVEADLVFSCPPYADLEVYSDDPHDISTMPYDDFIVAYREIIRKSVAMLKNDRFACFVVGEVRDKKGMYRDFVGDTVQAFVDAGAAYYNEAILVTQIASLAIRAGGMFTKTRKLGKTHQNILVFVKGDPKKATQACGDVEVAELDVAESVD